MVSHKRQGVRADIVDVAKAARVSPSTVSRSFNHPDLVNPATRKKIDAAIKKLGYIRNRAAQAMHGKRSATIGLIVPTVNHAIFAEVIQSFSDQVDVAGFTILMTSHGYDLDREYRMLRKMLEHRVDGVALIGLDHAPETHALIAEQGVPAMTIWNYDSHSNLSCVGADNYLAGRLAAQHLIDLGHRNIGMVFPTTHNNDRARGRLSGALSAMNDAGIDVPDDWRSEARYSLAQAKRACIELLTENRPTALLCGNDVIAQGAVYAAQKLELDVPSDLSIIGIGGFKGADEMEPALTTIRIPADVIGKRAGAHLIEMIGNPSGDVVRDECEVTVIERATTAPISA
jgi:LacI family transcriptional regulator